MRTIVISLLLVLVGTGYCGPARNQNPLVGNYALQGHDDSGALVFNGTISVTSFENSQLKGMCKVTKVSTTFAGTVDKDGPCEGKVSGDKITLDLAPMLFDGGLVFEGQWSEGRMTGTWRIESMLGGRTFGTFEALRR